jgi:hypothetical protein
MPGGGGNARQTRGSASQETKTKGKKVDTNTYTALSYDSDVSIEETNEGDSIEDTIEVLEEPRAPKSKRVQQKQTETSVSPMVSNLHLLEVMQILRTTINKVRNDQERMGKMIGEWVSYLKQEVLERSAETNFLRDEIRQSRIELWGVKAEMVEVKEELVEVREELAKVAASLRSTSTSIEQSQQAQAQAHAQVQAQVEAQVQAQVEAQVQAQV